MKKLLLILVLSLFIVNQGVCDINLSGIRSYAENYDLVDDYIDMARLYTSSAEYEKALEYIDTIDKISPNNPKILYEKAVILKNYNQPILARNLMQEVVQIAPEYKESYLYREFFGNELQGFYIPRDYDSDYFIKKGQEAYDEGKYEKALEYFKKAVQQRRDVETLNNLGRAYIKSSKPKIALKCFEDAIALDIKYPETYINLAQYYSEIMKDSKKQMHYLKHAIKLDSKNPKPYYMMGSIYYDKSMYDTAADYYRQALTKDDTYFEAYYALGETLYKLQNYDEAYQVFKKSLNLELDNPNVYELLAKISIKLRKYDEAKSYAEKLITYRPSPDNYLLLAEALYLSGNYDEAINILNTKITDPKISKKYNQLGLCNYQLNNYNAAVNNFKAALAIEEKPIYLYNLAVCFNTLGNKTNMDIYVNKAVKIVPKDVQDYIDIAKIYQDLGQTQNVLNTLNSAIIAYPNERQLYNLKLQLLKQTGKMGEYNTFNVYTNSKFPKDPLYLGK